MAPITTLSELMIAGNTAVVTGASSGIGRASALSFAKAGMNVWMVDVDAKELLDSQKLAKQLASDQQNQLILAEIVDVTDPKAVELLAEQVFDAVQACHVLMNNAGIGLGGGALLSDLDTIHQVFNVNTFGPVHGCLAFVPRMLKSGKAGLIINTGSKQGITMPPGNLTYNMSKAALKCYTEGLEHELRSQQQQQHLVRAVLLVPGWVNTNILLKAERAKAAAVGKDYDANQAFFHENKPQDGAWMPQQVFDFMKDEVDKGRFYIVCPDNDVDRETDNLRMTWTMQDITKDRPPLSRWHPDYADEFAAFVEKSSK